MHPNVKPTLRRVLGDFEGVRHSMYLDAVGLVTVGIGFLIDPFSRATAIRLGNWSRRGGGPVTAGDLRQEWDNVKRRTIGYRCQLRLSNRSIEPLFDQKANGGENMLIRIFSQFGQYPADAQLGMLCLTWLRASEPGYRRTFPEFIRCCTRRDWRRAGIESLWQAIQEARGGPQNRRIRRRNAQLRMFDNAAVVEDSNRFSSRSMPIQNLHYPYMARPPSRQIAEQIANEQRRATRYGLDP